MSNHTVISRRDASLLGRTRFFTGRECKHGHLSQRFVSSGNCVECGAERSRSFTKVSNATRTAHAMGRFFYDLHPDDFPAALAYCQALDLQRGRAPSDPDAPRPQPTAEDQARMIAEHRDRIAKEPRK